MVKSADVTRKLFSELAERYRTREGGYTRVLKLRTRVGDAAPISLVELVDRPAPSKAKATEEKPAKAAKPKKTSKKDAAEAAKPAKGRKKAAAG